MNSSSKEAGLYKKQEADTSDRKTYKASTNCNSPWIRSKDPRIVRVSRAFGGKDRHSKVCTIRGLRDRRVRLSVPTAIQLYDLQDRLGLNQPSKVIDWLLDVAKQEIDELPPLPEISPLNFSQNYQPLLTTNRANSSQEGLKSNNSLDLEDSSRLLRWSSDAFLREKSKRVANETMDEDEKEDKEGIEKGNNEYHVASSSSNHFLPKAYHHHHPSFQGLLSNAMPYGSYYHWEPSNIALSHLGSHGFSSQAEDIPNLNVISPAPPSTLSLSAGSQILVCPPGATQSYFPSHVATSQNMFGSSTNSQNLFSSHVASHEYPSGQSMRPFHFSLTPIIPHYQKSGGSDQPANKD